MSTDTIRAGSCPKVFEAGLPAIAYDHLTDAFEAHRIIAEARRQVPIAIGPHGPEVLSYELVRTVLRDPRFITAHGLGLDMQGITSGPLWERATKNILGLDGDQHHRLRRLVSKAFAPRGVERLRTLIVDIITELVDPPHPSRALRCRQRHRPPIPDADHLRTTRCAPRGLAVVLRLDR